MRRLRDAILKPLRHPPGGGAFFVRRWRRACEGSSEPLALVPVRDTPLIETDAMSTHDWMKSEYSGQGPAARLQPAKRVRSPLEIGLMGAGVIAWGWCLYEVAMLLLK